MVESALLLLLLLQPPTLLKVADAVDELLLLHGPEGDGAVLAHQSNYEGIDPNYKSSLTHIFPFFQDRQSLWMLLAHLILPIKLN